MGLLQRNKQIQVKCLDHFNSELISWSVEEMRVRPPGEYKGQRGLPQRLLMSVLCVGLWGGK